MEYTKGEWGIVIHGLTSKIMAGKYLVAEGIYRKDNARLISAAPDMYKALKAFEKYLSTGYPDNMKLKVVASELLEKAITKAERG